MQAFSEHHRPSDNKSIHQLDESKCSADDWHEASERDKEGEGRRDGVCMCLYVFTQAVIEKLVVQISSSVSVLLRSEISASIRIY